MTEMRRIVDEPPPSIETGPDTQFKQEFKAFLAQIGFKLRHFLPDETVDEPMFPDCLIPRATGFERLRGEGGLSEELAVRWKDRSDLFLAEAIKRSNESGKRLSLNGISFINYERDQPSVNWKKLISLYEADNSVPVTITINKSIDDIQVADIWSALRGILGDTEIRLTRVNEGCTEITILIPRQKAAEVIAFFANEKTIGAVVEVEEATIPPEGSIARSLFLDGPAIDSGRPDALDRFREVWSKARRIESVVRPWRRLRWLASRSIHLAPIASVISESNDRAYAADHRDKRGSFAADIRMTCLTWPLFAALTLTLILLVLRPFFPFLSISWGVATGLAVALAGAQVCASALSPIACGAGTIVMCWAFGLAQAFAIGASGNAGALGRLAIQKSFFLSITGGIVGISAPNWRSHVSQPIVVLLLVGIVAAITAAGWFMAQPSRVCLTSSIRPGRVALGAIVGSGMGGAIGVVRLAATLLGRLGCPQQVAFITAFAVVGSLTFAFALRLRMPDLRKGRLAGFALTYALIACSLCGLAYQSAGGPIGLMALAASTGFYQATWFTAASIVGNRIGAASAAVIATTLEGAVGFAIFVVFGLLQR